MALYFEDFSPGQVYESQGRTITEADVAGFAAWSWDANPVHTDADLMASSRFGERIAHGLLGMSVGMGLASRTGVFEACSIALTGVDNWTFHLPLHIGDTVTCRIKIRSVRLTSSGAAGILERRFELVNQQDQIVQRGDIALMVSTTPS
jgi:acyl dehydratase